jgi:hypothetical protein
MSGNACALNALSDPGAGALPRVVVAAAAEDETVVPAGHCEIWRDGKGNVCAHAARDADRWCLTVPGVAEYVFSAGEAVVRARPDSGVSADHVRRVYARAVLPLVLHAQGRELLHASAVAGARGVIAFAADSGTGKSTLAGALAKRGHSLWADDAVAFDAGGGDVLTWRLLSAPLPDAAACARLAGIVVLGREMRGRGSASLERLSGSAAFPAVMSHAFCLSLDDQQRKRLMTEQYLALVGQVPVWELRYPTGLDRLEAAARLIESRLLSAS